MKDLEFIEIDKLIEKNNFFKIEKKNLIEEKKRI